MCRLTDNKIGNSQNGKYLTTSILRQRKLLNKKASHEYSSGWLMPRHAMMRGLLFSECGAICRINRALLCGCVYPHLPFLYFHWPDRHTDVGLLQTLAGLQAKMLFIQG